MTQKRICENHRNFKSMENQRVISFGYFTQFMIFLILLYFSKPNFRLLLVKVSLYFSSKKMIIFVITEVYGFLEFALIKHRS